ncbi:MAG: hypothetical protein ACPGN3_01005 [Opitutales bacterium]
MKSKDPPKLTATDKPDASLWMHNLSLRPFERIDQMTQLANDLATLRKLKENAPSSRKSQIPNSKSQKPRSASSA